jgi:hypothetical protein
MVVASPASDSYGAGRPGGSGGGASNWQSSNTGAGGAGTAVQGFNGGSSTTSSGDGHQGGGGGGAGGTGAAGLNRNPGAGGAGLSFGILGAPYYFAGGGGGGCYYVTAAVGGIGGGGGGASNTSTSSAGGGSALNSGGTGVSGSVGGAGGANTGGGGGGAGGTGGAGGSGIVVVRYTTQAVGNTSDATTDNLVDSPTLYGHDMGLGGEVVGNYATLNPISSVPPYGQTTPTLSNGNLTYSGVSGYTNVDSSIAITSGRMFFEVTLAGTVSDASAYIIGLNSPGGYFRTAGIRGNATGNGITFTTGSNFSYASGDVIGVAFDYDINVITYFKNGVQQCTGTTNGALNRPISAWIQSGGNASVVFHVNFGQRAWAYAPPQGFSALTTKNFARPTGSAAAPNQYFDTVLYTGTGAAQTITMPSGFTPDFVWIKRRNSANSHLLADSVRGNTKVLLSNDTGAELTDASYTTFVSGGFSVSGTGNEINNSSAPYIAWCWKANGAAVSNTAGTITSQVSANTASGFSIVTYTGNGTAGATIGHGLDVAPSVIFPKVRSRSGDNWHCYHSALGGTQGILLNATNAASTDAGFWNNTNPTSSVITLGAYNTFSGQTYVAYCWAEVPGFSKFGSFTANGSVDGPFVYTGFKPRWIMIKASSSTSQWVLIDTARDTFNSSASSSIFANSNSAEETGNTAEAFDIVSNGFKLRSNGRVNVNGVTHIYMAFADKPFGNVNGTAR